ncbi:hypothetical protein MTO96_002658 [Rhipicephalus appendiculatus]
MWLPPFRECACVAPDSEGCDGHLQASRSKHLPCSAEDYEESPEHNVGANWSADAFARTRYFSECLPQTRGPTSFTEGRRSAVPSDLADRTRRVSSSKTSTEKALHAALRPSSVLRERQCDNVCVLLGLQTCAADTCHWDRPTAAKLSPYSHGLCSADTRAADCDVLR